MKRFHSLLIFIFFFQAVLFSQTKTIKTTKKTSATASSTTTKKKRHFAIQPYAGGNYTFKNNKKLGYEAGVTLSLPIFHTNRHGLSIGPEYCVEQQYFQLSEFNSSSKLPETAFTKSQNRVSYLKIPIKLLYRMDIARSLSVEPFIGLKPEYLLTIKDEHQRLQYSDFNQYNLAWIAGLGVPIKHFTLFINYSNDLFENLKDRNIYDSNGRVIGKKKSKTNLISLSLHYSF